MAAPEAPVIDLRTAQAGAMRVRWVAVADAETYIIYVEGAALRTVTGVPGWNEAVVQVSQGDDITLTAVNAGAEESDPSNTATVGPIGSMVSHGSSASPFG